MRLRFCVSAIIAVTFSASATAHASSVKMTGHVAVICQLAEVQTYSPETRQLTATLNIFCNSANGAIVSASLVSGDSRGYEFNLGATSRSMRPGETTELLFLPTAYNGSQAVDIVPLNALGIDIPVVRFDVTAE